MHEYTLVHILSKRLISTEALLKSFKKLLGQAWIDFRVHIHNSRKLAWVEEFTQLEEKGKQGNRDIY